MKQVNRLTLVLFFFGYFSVFAADKDLAPYEFDYFFDPSRLVHVELQLKEADWDHITAQHRSLVKTLRTDIPPSEQEKPFDYVPAELTIDGTKVGRVAVRKKGLSARWILNVLRSKCRSISLKRVEDLLVSIH